MRYLTGVALLTVYFIFGRCTSQGQSAFSAAERAKVQFLVGTFTTVTYIPPMSSTSKGDTGRGTSVLKWTLDSMFLSLEDQSASTVLGRYKGHGMLGFDTQTHQFVLSMFSNFGDHPIYHGTFVGDTLELQTTIPMPKGTFDQKLLWYKDGEAVKLRVLNDLGKGPHLALEQTAVPAPQETK